VIKKIEIKGLRGKSFDIELEPITLVIGENTKGKTTIADAIRWGLLGYIPGMPQPPRGWAELIGSGETGASVRIEHVDGSRIQRSINLEKGAVKIAGSGIEEEGFNLNLLTLDPAQFFAATGPVRAQMVAEAASGGFDWNAQLPDRLRRFGWEGHSEWPDWIGRAIERAKQERSLSADKKKTLTATLRGLEGIRGIVVGDDTGAKEALAKGQQALGGLKEQLRAVDAQIGKVNLPQPNPAQGQLDAVTRALQEFLGKTHDEATFAERLKDCQERLQMLKLTEGEPPDQRTLAKWRSDLVKLSNDEAVAQSRVKLFKEGAKTIEAKYAKLRKLGQCPTCGTSGKALEGALAKAEKFELAQHKAQLKEAEDKWTQTGQAHEELETKCKEAEEAIEKRSELEMELAELG
jgi:DNA repair exonuclease SbcCD ATPase subunit